MNSLNSWLGTQLPSLFWLLISAGIFFLLVVLCMYAWRIISRPHVRNAVGRNRQPRLGVLDSYSVDRVRQLVLVRRDNVEHLIMIGGPNDLVVESQIIRVHAQTQATPLREKENASAQSVAAPKIPTPSQPAVAVTPAPMAPPQPQAQ